MKYLVNWIEYGKDYRVAPFSNRNAADAFIVLLGKENFTSKIRLFRCFEINTKE